jgi:hypothetical protein
MTDRARTLLVSGESIGDDLHDEDLSSVRTKLASREQLSAIGKVVT